MLYDKRWDKTEVKADPFSLEAFIGWLEKQPANKTYEFMNCQGACLLGQYMASVGEPWSDGKYVEIAHSMCRGYKGFDFYIGVTRPHTFGAALDRARKALAHSS